VNELTTFTVARSAEWAPNSGPSRTGYSRAGRPYGSPRPRRSRGAATAAAPTAPRSTRGSSGTATMLTGTMAASSGRFVQRSIDVIWTPRPQGPHLNQLAPQAGANRSGGAPQPKARQRAHETSTATDTSSPQRRRRSDDPGQQRNPARTRQLILAAASEEFGRFGYDGARVMRIAALGRTVFRDIRSQLPLCRRQQSVKTVSVGPRTFLGRPVRS
jgi:hypothetical protein